MVRIRDRVDVRVMVRVSKLLESHLGPGMFRVIVRVRGKIMVGVVGRPPHLTNLKVLLAEWKVKTPCKLCIYKQMISLNRKNY